MSVYLDGNIDRFDRLLIVDLKRSGHSLKKPNPSSERTPIVSADQNDQVFEG
jgi:hypothetical protein